MKHRAGSSKAWCREVAGLIEEGLDALDPGDPCDGCSESLPRSYDECSSEADQSPPPTDDDTCPAPASAEPAMKRALKYRLKQRRKKDTYYQANPPRTDTGAYRRHEQGPSSPAPPSFAAFAQEMCTMGTTPAALLADEGGGLARPQAPPSGIRIITVPPYPRDPAPGSVLSDDGSDCCSVEAPGPGLQVLMRRALAEEGALAGMVLAGTADLSRAVELCLEVLGIGTSSQEQQAAAAWALAELCTHEDLRPAVDNLLVLRRLCRIIELTKTATALAAAVEALHAVADDTAWQNKGGCVAEALRDALERCVATMAAAAAALGSKPAPQDPGRAGLLALAAAAAAALRPQALHLLSAAQLTEAAGALATCLACGSEPRGGLAALAAVLRHCKDAGEPLRVAAAVAVAESGAPEVLVRSGVSGTQSVQLTASASDAFSCLAHVLVACGGPGSSGAQMAAWRAAKAGFGALAATGAAALASLLLSEPTEEAGRALHVLLVLWRCGAAHDGSNMAFTAALAAAVRVQGGDTAFLRAVRSLLTCRRPGMAPEVARLLMTLCAYLLESGRLPAEQLWQLAPGLAEAAVGILTGTAPGPAWSAFGPAAVLSSTATKVSYPSMPMTHAATLVCALLECAAGADGTTPLRAWLPASSIARVVAARLVQKDAGVAEMRCLALALQLAVPGEAWAGDHFGILEPLAVAVKAALPLETEEGRSAGPQLAVAVLLSGWAASGGTHPCGGNISKRSVNQPAPCSKCSARKALLKLAAAVLTQQADYAASTMAAVVPAAERLAALGGALNAVVACLRPQRALAGAGAQLLSPRLPEELLEAVKGAGTGPAEPVLSYCMNRHIGARELRWFFEEPTTGYNYDSYGQRTRTPTVASATAMPLLRAMAAAAGRINQLAAEAGPGAAAVLPSALRVAGSVANVLCDCYPAEGA